MNLEGPTWFPWSSCLFILLVTLADSSSTSVIQALDNRVSHPASQSPCRISDNTYTGHPQGGHSGTRCNCWKEDNFVWHMLVVYTSVSVEPSCTDLQKIKQNKRYLNDDDGLSFFSF